MGKRPAAELSSGSVRFTIKNYKLRITKLKLWLQFSLFVCALCIFTTNAFAQDNFELLAEKIRRGNTEQKRDALLQIRNYETAEASRIAIPALRDSSEIVRATAAFSVIFLPADEAFAVLSPLLTDKSEFVRREAVYALGKVKNPLAVNPLLQVFQKDKIAEVKNAAVVALGDIGDVSAVDALTQILRGKPKNENEADDFLRRSAARSVGQIAQNIRTGNTKVITTGIFVPDSLKVNAVPEQNKFIERFPVFRPANVVLISILRNAKEHDDTKREAAFALGAIGDESAIPVLQSSTNDEDYYLAEISREALRKIELYSRFTESK
ncbi:MAG TPA: HEAT repeat domain-containing protein [Pyrinomonadaceae bacterium]|jgi:HEAT repeat protein